MRGSKMTATKQIVIGVCIAVLSSATYGIINMYDQITLNSAHRAESALIEEDIKSLKRDVHVLRKDVCWIKEHLRGETIPKCNIRD